MKTRLRRIALALAALAIVGAVVGAGHETLARRRAARDFPAPGQLVDVGGSRRIQIDCRGAGSPTIVLEAGLDAYGSLSWAAVHDSLGATTRTCAYSRAGIMWSDPASGPFDSGRAAEDLHAALAAAGERAPLVVVGHSLGAPYALTFTRRFPNEVAGLVFVDGSHPDQVARLAGAGAAPPTTVRALVWTGSRVGPTLLRLGVARLVPDLGSLDGWTPRERAAFAAHASSSLAAMLRELRAVDATFANARGAEQLGDRPLAVLTGMRRENPDTAAAARWLAEWKALHDEEARWSTRGRRVVLPDATHYIHVDQPAVVIAEVRRVVLDVRSLGRGDQQATP